MRKERDGAPGGSFGKLVAEGDGWRVLDIVCTAGPRDRPFEERHAWTSISMVMAGSFNYRSDRGCVADVAGRAAARQRRTQLRMFASAWRGRSMRLVSIQPGFVRRASRVMRVLPAPRFSHDRIPPLRALAPITARIATAIDRGAHFEEIGLELAGAVIQIDSDLRCSRTARRATAARIADVIRHLEAHLDQPHPLADLASIAGLSRYHFLRTFRRVTGVTPHQWILRARLREAARRLASSGEPITEIALDVGFEDLSNFIRSFRAEFGISPRGYRAASWLRRRLT